MLIDVNLPRLVVVGRVEPILDDVGSTIRVGDRRPLAAAESIHADGEPPSGVDTRLRRRRPDTSPDPACDLALAAAVLVGGVVVTLTPPPISCTISFYREHDWCKTV